MESGAWPYANSSPVAETSASLNVQHLGQHLPGDRNRIPGVDRELVGAGRDPSEIRERDTENNLPVRRHDDTVYVWQCIRLLGYGAP